MEKNQKPDRPAKPRISKGLVLMSDTRGLHREINVPDGDMLIQAEEQQRNFLVMPELSAMLDERVAHYRAHSEDTIPNKQVMANARAILLKAHSARAQALRDARDRAKRGSA